MKAAFFQRYYRNVRRLLSDIRTYMAHIHVVIQQCEIMCQKTWRDLQSEELGLKKTSATFCPVCKAPRYNEDVRIVKDIAPKMVDGKPHATD